MTGWRSFSAVWGTPQDDLKVIHVAGTNGKGSVSKYLEEGLSACGYKMGLYTSPYIETFNERIRYDGADISDEDLEYYGQKVVSAAEAMVADGLDSPTEFEVVTAIAFLYFAGRQADITILEVGLGGIGDSTNVVKSRWQASSRPFHMITWHSWAAAWQRSRSTRRGSSRQAVR